MRFSTAFSAAFLSAVLPLAVTATPAAVNENTFEFNITAHARGLQKRVDDAQLTFYDIEVGIPTACGAFYQNSDFVVALDIDLYGTGQDSFRTITITAEGKTATAQIVDECPTCPNGGLDLTEGLFSFFADLSAGVLTGSWNFD
ncbi:hypothetical protein M0805_007194 [Coniferiporia weirii]|nr:hypothetical protein M0805_007194 [Coniferiporia weirii]